jgi:hypothetical protein
MRLNVTIKKLGKPASTKACIERYGNIDGNYTVQ